MDRNSTALASMKVSITSLSARRAWIEIIEEVSKYVVKESLSARRAWIEITYVTRLPRAQVVALRKESVDRNETLIVLAE